MNIPDTVNILGTEYKIILVDKDGNIFDDNCDMFFKPETKEIFMNMESLDSAKKELMFTMSIVRAFLFESGLSEEKIRGDYDFDVAFVTAVHFLKILDITKKFDKKKKKLTKVDVLGTKYRIIYSNHSDVADCDSYIIPYHKKIVINFNNSDEIIKRSIIRWTFIAFFLERGLDRDWIYNNVLSNWFMIQFTKIEKVVNMLKQ